MKLLTLILSFFFFLHVSNAQVSDFETIDFSIANQNAILHQKASLENLPLLSYHLTNNLKTDVEKFRAIFIWVTHNIENDYNLFQSIYNKRKKLKHDSVALTTWNNEQKKKVFKRLLKRKRTMCTGYAYLIRELSKLANLDCIIIDGYGRTINSNIKELDIVNHSWNAVKLNNKWYLCDATWASGYFVLGSFVKDYNDGYFLTEPNLFAKNHYPVQKKWLLTTLNKNKFIESPIIYSEAFKYNLLPILPLNLETTIKKNEKLHFRLKTKNAIDLNDISLITLDKEEKELEIDNLQQSNHLITFSKTFKNRGVFDIHLKIKNEPITSYTVKVTK